MRLIHLFLWSGIRMYMHSVSEWLVWHSLCLLLLALQLYEVTPQYQPPCPVGYCSPASHSGIQTSSLQRVAINVVLIEVQ